MILNSWYIIVDTIYKARVYIEVDTTYKVRIYKKSDIQKNQY